MEFEGVKSEKSHVEPYIKMIKVVKLLITRPIIDIKIIMIFFKIILHLEVIICIFAPLLRERDYYKIEYESKNQD